MATTSPPRGSAGRTRVAPLASAAQVSQTEASNPRPAKAATRVPGPVP